MMAEEKRGKRKNKSGAAACGGWGKPFEKGCSPNPFPKLFNFVLAVAIAKTQERPAGSPEMLKGRGQAPPLRLRFYMGRRERSASAIHSRRPVKRFEEIQRETFSKVSLWSLILLFLISFANFLSLKSFLQ